MLTARDGLEILAEHRSRVGDGIAGTQESAHENAVFIVEIMLEVDNPVVALVIVLVCAEEIGNRSRRAANLRRPQRVQYALHHRVDRDTVVGHQGLSFRDPGIRRYRGGELVARQEFLLLVGQEEECLVFEDRTAYRKTVLVVLDRRVESVHGQKGIVRCERIIAVEVIRTAVECIGAGLHHHIYH